MGLKFNNVEPSEIIYNETSLSKVIYNNQIVWEKSIDPETSNMFNFTGMDSNGNLVGQLDFNGTIVAYAVGKPTITIDENTTPASETITYDKQNGFNPTYFNVQSLPDSPQIIPSSIVIPNTYQGKPVKKILENAFLGWQGNQQAFFEYQCNYIQSITLGTNVEEIDEHAFVCNRCTTLNIPQSLKKVSAFGFDMIKADIDLPTGVIALGGAINYDLTKCGKCIFRCANVNTYITSNNTNGSLDYINEVIFKSTVQSLTTKLFYYNMPSILVFEHNANDIITIDIPSIKSASNVTIYADNLTVRNYDWASKNITATIKYLNEYTGEYPWK